MRHVGDYTDENVKRVMKLNPEIANPNVIMAGQSVRVPRPPGAPPAPARRAAKPPAAADGAEWRSAGDFAGDDDPFFPSAAGKNAGPAAPSAQKKQEKAPQLRRGRRGSKDKPPGAKSPGRTGGGGKAPSAQPPPAKKGGGEAGGGAKSKRGLFRRLRKE